MKVFLGNVVRCCLVPFLLLLHASLFAATQSTPAFTNFLGQTLFKPSLRFRYDYTEFEKADGIEDRERYRIRARLGLIHEFNEHFNIGARVSTGSQEPTSSQIDLGNDWEGFEYKLDQAYVRYAPVPEFNVWAGQIPNPILEADLLWDKDVNPQGLGEQLTWRASEETELFVNAGQFFLAHFWDDTDPKVLIAQVGVEWKRAPGSTVRGGLAYYDYLQVKGEVVPFQRETNSRRPDGSLRYDFDVLALFGEYDFKVPIPLLGTAPLRLTVEASENLAAPHAGTGFKVDVRLGETDRRGAATLLYAFERLERDATLDALSESSWHAQRANFFGHRLSGRYYVSDRMYLNVSLRFMRAIEGPKDDQQQLNLDMGWEF